VHSPWLARANEPAPQRLDSRTRVQIVLACELVEPMGLKFLFIFYFPLIKIAMLVLWLFES
jgi:hypothetical protein